LFEFLLLLIFLMLVFFCVDQDILATLFLDPFASTCSTSTTLATPSAATTTILNDINMDDSDRLCDALEDDDFDNSSATSATVAVPRRRIGLRKSSSNSGGISAAPTSSTTTTTTTTTTMSTSRALLHSNATTSGARFALPRSRNDTLQFVVSGATSQRTVQTSGSYDTWREYAEAQSLLVREELNLRLASRANAYFFDARMAGATAGGGHGSQPLDVPTCRHGRLPLRTVRKDGASHGRRFFSCRDCNVFKWADGGTNGRSLNSNFTLKSGW
jgi:hypothetical protein